jgi:PHD/YefM family antitoxin component YafN of YafNO toxin-antitoxin module
MTAAEHVPLAEVKNRLSEVESLEETLAILSDPELMAAIEEADAEVAADSTTRLSEQEALAEIDR